MAGCPLAKNLLIGPPNGHIKLRHPFKVQADSTATAVEVTTTDTGNGKDFIVISGLNVGDKIVTTGANNVAEGQKVLFSAEEKAEAKSE